MKIWVKYGNEEARIDLEGCEFVSDLRKKIYEEFGIQVPSTKLILKWKNEELKARTKLSSLNLSEAIDPQNDTSFLIVQLPQIEQISSPKPSSPKIMNVEDVCEWMKSLKLTKDYSDIIKSNGIDGEALKHMTTKNLWNEIGITAIGDCLKILAAIPKITSS